MTKQLDPQPTLLSVYEYRHFIYGDKFVPHPKDDSSLEINFENTLLEIFIGERSNLLFKQRITEEDVNLLSSLAESDDCSFEKLNKIFEPTGLSITDVTDDYVCFEIEGATENVNIKFLLDQLFHVAKNHKGGLMQFEEQLCDEIREEQFDIPTPETLKRLQADESNSAYFNKPMSEIFLRLHKGDFYPYFDRSLIDKAGLKTEDATEKGFFLLKFSDGSELTIEG